jgi:hypothetical protein
MEGERSPYRWCRKQASYPTCQYDPTACLPGSRALLSRLWQRGVVVVWGLTVAVGVQGQAPMSIWGAAVAGDLAEVERLVGQDPGLLDAQNANGSTPLMAASMDGHVGVVRWLLDKGPVMIDRVTIDNNSISLWIACFKGHAPVVKLLMERGADPALLGLGKTALTAACGKGHLEVVRVLVGHPSGKANIDHRDVDGMTALWVACAYGRGEVARVLLESGADPTIASSIGTTPMAIAKQATDDEDVSAEGRRECVAALKVSFRPSLYSSAPGLLVTTLDLLSWALWQEAERAYLLWKARQVADQQGSGAVAVPRGKEGEALVEYVLHGLKGDLVPDLMEYLW